MAYTVERNRRTGKLMLVPIVKIRRQNIGPRGSWNRRLIVRNGRNYHVTKGWRR